MAGTAEHYAQVPAPKERGEGFVPMQYATTSAVSAVPSWALAMETPSCLHEYRNAMRVIHYDHRGRVGFGEATENWPCGVLR